MKIVRVVILVFCMALLSSGCDERVQSFSSRGSSAAISGHIYLAGSLKPIWGVTVTIANQSDMTMKSGRYEISGLPSGSHELHVSHSAYEPYSTMVYLSIDGELVHDVFLELKDTTTAN